MLTPRQQVLVNDFAAMLADLVRDAIRNKKVTKYGAVNASGRLANSVEYFVSPDKLEVSASAYIYQLVYGRKPGQFPPVDDIARWIDEKGITPRDKISKKSLAYLIARSIANNGTLIHQQGGSTLLDDVLNEERIDELIGIIGPDLAETIASEIVAEFR